MPLGANQGTVLEHIAARLSMSTLIDKIVFAIPDTQANDCLYDFLTTKNFSVYRGSENNVLKRYYECAKLYTPAIIVRATCDNPLMDWEHSDEAIKLLHEKSYDYVSMKGFPLGTASEVFTFSALEQAFENATELNEQEHVTPYLYQHPKQFRIGVLHNKCDQTDFCRLTVDTPEDYELMRIIYDKLYQGKPIVNTKVMELFAAEPQLLLLNKDVEQKKI